MVRTNRGTMVASRHEAWHRHHGLHVARRREAKVVAGDQRQLFVHHPDAVPRLTAWSCHEAPTISRHIRLNCWHGGAGHCRHGLYWHGLPSPVIVAVFTSLSDHFDDDSRREYTFALSFARRYRARHARLDNIEIPPAGIRR